MKATKIIALVMALALCVSLFAACGSNNGNTSSQTKMEKAIAGADYNNIIMTIGEKDYDKMQDVVSSLANGKFDFSVLKITGESERRSSNCSIIVKNDKGEGRGLSWQIIDGKYPDDYPEDGATVTITGVLTKDDNNASVLMVPADKVETK